MFKVQTSRRVTDLRPEDYDHEIGLVDHDGTISRYTTNTDETGAARVSRVSTTAALLPPTEEEGNLEESENSLERDHDAADHVDDGPSEHIQREQELPGEGTEPAVEVQAATPSAKPHDPHHPYEQRHKGERETAIDVLYENERGGFLCGMALFSAAALGGLDATPWTNAYHKPSPTTVHTATVPDPSWEWVWSQWHVNQQDGMDEGGWEYSFAFSKKFSWHEASWWNSFVRRRAWTRKRARREVLPSDPHMLNSEYFTVRPASYRTKRSRESLRSRVPSKASMTQLSATEILEEQADVEDADMLMQRLRVSRVDREKLEAVDNYLEHAIDLSQLEHYMHEIMKLFVFQASRRILLGRLIQIYDEVKAELDDEKGDPETRDREEALRNAIGHADEEVRRLAYWSDVKQMAEKGESRGAVDKDKGWYDTWDGIDQSGPTAPNSGKLPGK